MNIQKNKFRRNSFNLSDNRIVPLVCLGDAVFKGTATGVTRVLRSRLKEAARENKLVLIKVDDYLISQVSVMRNDKPIKLMFLSLFLLGLFKVSRK